MKTELLEFLISVGRGDSKPLVNLSEAQTSALALANHQPFKDWDGVCEDLPIEDVEYLLKGLVCVENELRLIGGSVAGTRWLAQIYGMRAEPLDAFRVYEWCVQNARNHYVPFGSTGVVTKFFATHGRGVAESAATDFWSTLHDASEAKYRDDLGAARENAENRKRIRKDRNRVAHEARQTQYKGRGGILKDEIEFAEKLDLESRLVWLARTDIPLPAIPKDLFESDISGLRVDRYVQMLLRRKVDGWKQKHWRRLAAQLPPWPVRSHAANSLTRRSPSRPRYQRPLD